jgi:hypothetical protein
VGCKFVESWSDPFLLSRATGARCWFSACIGLGRRGSGAKYLKFARKRLSLNPSIHDRCYLPNSKMHNDKGKPFAPLAPGPPRILPIQASMAVNRPKKNSTACLACKTAKRKVIQVLSGSIT